MMLCIHLLLIIFCVIEMDVTDKYLFSNLKCVISIICIYLYDINSTVGRLIKVKA